MDYYYWYTIIMRTQNIYELFVGGRNFTIDRGRFSPGVHGLQIFVIVPESNGLGPSPSIGFVFIIKGIVLVLVIIINLCNVRRTQTPRRRERDCVHGFTYM